MKSFECKGCGSNDFHDEDGYRICDHCGRKHVITQEDKAARVSNIELQNDIDRLLEKCREDPARAKKYAQRILEMDPNNIQAQNIFYNKMTKPYTTSSGCYVATAIYGSYDCPQVWTLRRYRDNILSKSWHGRAFIRTYYAVSPTLVKWFGRTEWFKNLWKPRLDRMVTELNSKGVKDTPYKDKNR